MPDATERTLADQVLDSALMGEQVDDDDEPRGQQADTLPPPTPQQSRRQGGLQPLIDKKKKQIKEVEDRLLDPEESGAYTRTNEHGNQIFDYVEMQRDQVRLNQLRDQLTELRERDRQNTQTTTERNATARRVARQFLQAELNKISDKLKKPVAEAFGQIFKAMEDQGAFARPDMADQANVRNVMNQLFDTAYGNALRRSDVAPGKQPAPSGYSDGDEERKTQEEDNEEDPFTQNLMYAYDQRGRGRMTVAELKRREREAAAKKSQEASQ